MAAQRMIAIDIGNTEIKIADTRKVMRIATRELLDAASNKSGKNTLEELQQKIERFCAGDTATLVGISSVHPKAERAIRPLLKHCSVLTIDTLLDTRSNPLRRVLSTGTGNDRILGCVAALSMFRAPLITVDCGTATTVNLVNQTDEFAGGFIMPGVDTQLNSLARATAALPPVNKKGTLRIPGRTTEQAMRAGVLVGTAGAVAKCVRMLEKTVAQSCTVVLTGGNAALISTLVQNDVECSHVHDLVLLGILHLLKCYNKDVYGSDSPSRRSRRSIEGKDLKPTGKRAQRRN